MEKNIFEELNELYELDEANNFSSDHAKTALIKKYNKERGSNISKAQCVLHHLNGNHNDDTDLVNDLLIIGPDRDSAAKAHKILHLLSYAYIAEYLKSKLKELGVEFYYNPDRTGHPAEGPMGNQHEVELLLSEILQKLLVHNKKILDVADFSTMDDALRNHDFDKDFDPNN